MSILALASQKANWLAARQAIVSQNVANANTPGYAARDIRPFSEVLSQVKVVMTTTDPGHIPASGDNLDPSSYRKAGSESWETTVSGNSVVLEQEMMKGSDINRAFALGAGATKAFHRMTMAVAKVG